MIASRKWFGQTGAAAAKAALPAVFGAARASGGFPEKSAGPSTKKLCREDAATSDLWTCDNSTPIPDIRVCVGDLVKVRLINSLEEPPSIQRYGVRIANSMDGVSGLAQDPVLPGGTFEYDFEIRASNHLPVYAAVWKC